MQRLRKSVRVWVCVCVGLLIGMCDVCGWVPACCAVLQTAFTLRKRADSVFWGVYRLHSFHLGPDLAPASLSCCPIRGPPHTRGSKVMIHLMRAYLFLLCDRVSNSTREKRWIRITGKPKAWGSREEEPDPERGEYLSRLRVFFPSLSERGLLVAPALAVSR